MIAGDSAADYAARGPSFEAAWRILARSCEIPPSLDVFGHQLTLDQRKEPGLTPEGLARRIGRMYHRVPFRGFDRDDE